VDDYDYTTTWRTLIGYALKQHDEAWVDVVACAPDGDEWADVTFDNGHGIEEGCEFTLWTATRVYFPSCYDGAESVASVPRNPCDETTRHVGG